MDHSSFIESELHLNMKCFFYPNGLHAGQDEIRVFMLAKLTCVCPQSALAFVDTLLLIGDHLESIPCAIKQIRLFVVLYKELCWVVGAIFSSECSAVVTSQLEISKNGPCVCFL